MTNIYTLYSGFTLEEARGNNAFSFDSRQNQSIYVAALVEGGLQDLEVSADIAFSEVVDGKEWNYNGLKNFIHLKYQGTECFIFDNHNHAFFFWAYAIKKGIFKPGATLVHVDQHSDMRQPEKYLSKDECNDLSRVFEYTNYTLNVGNFIQPAFRAGIFGNVDIIDNSNAFGNTYKKPIVLDIDIDIFSEDMRYIKDDLKMKTIRTYANQADFITVASSPFFINQGVAIQRIKEIFLY